jgi:hypothetical protein
VSSGFNTEVRVGDQVFHVQTEDRGPANPILDTLVYHNGMVLLRRSSNYADLAASTDFTPEKLRQNVEDHHRAVVDDLRSGALAGEIAAPLHAQIQAREKANVAKGIQVQLLNPTAWLKAGAVSLDIAILRRADKRPVGGVEVTAMIEGALEASEHSAISDDKGRIRIEFPLPPLGKGDLALVIHAKAETAKDEIRFTMRSPVKSPSAGETK